MTDETHREVPLMLKNLTKRFGGGLSLPFLKKRSVPEATLAVDGVDLTIERGQIYGIVGSNGCGKSTLVRIVATLLLPDGGEAKVFGRDVVHEAHLVKRLISRVSVEPSFFKKLSPMENLIFTAQTYGMRRSAATAKILEILDRLSIDGKRARRPLEQMSRGMQQKVAIARAFMTSPILLLLDEPTTGLDPGSKIDVQRFVNEVRDTHDATVLLMSHDMDETASLCDSVAIMSEGKLVAKGSLASVLDQAGNGRPAPNLETAFLRLTGHQIADEERVEQR
ncbi:MAG: ABC transporter ATP-binding protein [Chloroflexi bacterium]|nr:ABC transporter ATP-binding protein [Chloroflexota bacterium]MCY3937680.1 ABC transporter ATP-binding protein [Chloroflexota bacterium]